MSTNVVGQENSDFFRHPKSNICSFLIMPKTQKMHAENLKTSLDHRRKGETLWLKKFFKKEKHR